MRMMGSDEVSEVLFKILQAVLTVETLTQTEARNNDISLVISQGRFLRRKIGGAIPQGQHVPPPTKITNGDWVVLGALQEKRFEIAVLANLIGKGVTHDGDPVTGPDW